MKKIAVILLSPGHKEGSEVTEVVSARIALSEFDVETSYFSLSETLDESQKISRGESLPLTELNPDKFDAIVLPGGSGMLKKFSTWATEQENFKINPILQKIILKFHSQSKPIGAICISPFLVGNILRQFRPLVTLGETSELIPRLEKMNIQHEKCPTQDYITDRDCKVLSTPAYMNSKVSPFQVYTGIRLMIKELVEMA